jgi:hypothetical protein
MAARRDGLPSLRLWARLALVWLGGAGRGLIPWEAAILLAGSVTLLTTDYVLHARRAAFSLLDLKLLSIKTFRASVTGGSLFRIGIGSIPFLLPLMLPDLGWPHFNPARSLSSPWRDGNESHGGADPPDFSASGVCSFTQY